MPVPSNLYSKISCYTLALKTYFEQAGATSCLLIYIDA